MMREQNRKLNLRIDSCIPFKFLFCLYIIYDDISVLDVNGNKHKLYCIYYVKLCFQFVFVCRVVRVSKMILDWKLIWSFGLFSRLFGSILSALYILNCSLTLSLWCLGNWTSMKNIFLKSWRYYVTDIYQSFGIMEMLPKSHKLNGKEDFNIYSIKLTKLNKTTC